MRYKSNVAVPQGPFYKALGIKLGRARRNAKITQAALAHAIGLSRTSVANMERGRQPLQVHTLLRIAEVLDVELDVLLPERIKVYEEKIVSQLARLAPPTQAWVRRVIETFSEEGKDGAEEVPSKKESKGIARSGKSKGSARAC